MMKKPEFTREFNYSHSRSGAPFSCADGTQYDVLKWDREHRLCIVALAKTPGADVVEFSSDGLPPNGNRGQALVMLPLGMIDGKPVFVGDEVETNQFTIDGSWEKVAVKPGDHGFTSCRWPAPAKVYPEFDGAIDSLSIEYMAHQQGNQTNSFARSLRAVANAALRHAVDAGQVLTADDAEAMRKAAYADGQASVVVSEEYKAFKLDWNAKLQADRTKREMLIAQAASEATYNAIYSGQRKAFCDLGLDLAAIIAGVPS